MRTDVPHPARMYDYYLGGKDNFAVDRGTAEAVLALAPEVRGMALANRAFLRRAVTFATGFGIRQFLDIGVGLPAAGDTYECAVLGTDQARAVYVDNDPMVLAHARALSTRPGRVRVVEGDLRDPGTLVQRAAGRAGLDFDRPVAVVLTAVLHYLSDADDPRSLVGRLMAATAPGSVLVLSHAAADLRPEAARTTAEAYRHSAAPLFPRSAREVGALFTGLSMVEPGLVPISSWRADRLPRMLDERQWMYAGVGLKPPPKGRWECSGAARGMPPFRRSCL
ncbi:SAM-dependent methyltransferase [Embleya sp. NBC_00896]|uniref:SAM-dependent methyltransferase n=1 Tax=Embleya sp. NBC_00896 TaxID=2975961 RepID=UPI0038706362|nr:SAM-dependent methyltransferase [Embleya sp. NBC_00896]